MPETENTTPVIRQPNPYIKERSREILSHTLRDREKMSARREHLKSHPEDRIKVDKWKLKDIVNFIDFKCHPDCSVAQGTAVKHSDIDLGLVICRKPVDQETQQKFIDELRFQGFDVCSEQELLSAKETETLLRHHDQKHLTTELMAAITDRVKKENQVIRFRTKQQCIQMTREPLNSLTAVYVAGKSIK